MSGIQVGGLAGKRELLVRPYGDRGELRLEVRNYENNGGTQSVDLGWVQVAALAQYFAAKRELFREGDWPKVAELGGPEAIMHRFVVGHGPEGNQREDSVLVINDPDAVMPLELDESGCCTHCGAPAVEESD